MYHTFNNPRLGTIKNGLRRNHIIDHGSVEIQNGKYASNRVETDEISDRIWWDTNGHNAGDNVLVTKKGGFKMSDPRSLADPYKGYLMNKYRTTERPNVSDVVRFKYDPIGNTYTAYSPFRKITNNKMSLKELFTPETINESNNQSVFTLNWQ